MVVGKITAFNKQNLPVLRDAINAALASVGEKYGVKLSAGNAGFSGIEAHFKLNMVVDDPKAQAEKERHDFNEFCILYDLEPKHFGTTVTARGERLTLVGLELKRRKFPIKMRNEDTGKVMLYTQMLVPAIKAAYAVAGNGVGRVRSAKAGQ